jgi:transcription antitermination protein NusB
VATLPSTRERALGLAYESELRGLSAAALLAELPVEPDEYARRIVLGADDHRDDIDALIRKYSEHWSLERMPVIDRALLRLGTYELAWVIETPKGAVITEAVELAKQYSTKDSGRFVNGLLARISAEVRPEEVRPEKVRSDDVDGPEDIDAE